MAIRLDNIPDSIHDKILEEYDSKRRAEHRRHIESITMKPLAKMTVGDETLRKTRREFFLLPSCLNPSTLTVTQVTVVPTIRGIDKCISCERFFYQPSLSVSLCWRHRRNQAHAFSVRENSPSGTVIGSDLNHFSINGSTGQLKTGEVLDCETQSTYEVVVAKAHIDSNDVATYSEEEFKTVIISVIEKPRRCLRRGGD